MSSVLDAVRPPQDWNVQRFDRVVHRVQQTGRMDWPFLSVFLDEGVVPRESRDDNFNRLGADTSNYLVVQPGDIVFNKLRTWQGGLGMSSYQGRVSPAYFVCRPSTDVEPRFLHYLLRSSLYLQELSRISKWMPPAQFDIGWEQLRLLPTLLPPIKKQQAIADFLDRETAHVETLARRKSALLQLLEERFDASIERSLNGWDRIPFKRVVDFKEGPGILAHHFHAQGVPLLRLSNVTGESVTLDGCAFLNPEEVALRWSHFAVREGDYLISASATMGTVAIVPPEASGAIPYTGIIRCRPRTSAVDMRFVRFFLRSRTFVSQIEMMRTGIGIQHYGPMHLSAMSMPMPPVEDQRRIAVELEHERRLVADLTANISQQLRHLKERRQALITAAVTGQIDIPSAA